MSFTSDGKWYFDQKLDAPDRHPNSCGFIDDIKGGAWVRCGWCKEETPWISKDNGWEFQHNDNCLRCNKELIYPDGAEW